MAKFTRMKTKKLEVQGLGRMTNKLLHEQAIRQNFQTIQGQERLNSASPSTRSPARNQNYMGGGLAATSGGDKTGSVIDDESNILVDNERPTYMKLADPLLQDNMTMEDGETANVSPRIDLEPLASASI